MAHCRFRLSDGQLLEVRLNDPAPRARAGEVVVEVEPVPDFRTDRWDDSASAVRPATAAELTAHDDALIDREATGGLGTPLNLTLADLFWDIERRLRIHGAPASSLAQIAAVANGNRAGYRAELEAIYKTHV